MSRSLNVKLNDKAFKQSIKSFQKAYPDVIKAALTQVGLRVVVQAVKESPLQDGFLIGAYTVSVTGEPTVKPNKFPNGGETGERSKQSLDPDQVAPVDESNMQKYELRVGNSMKYAARLNETSFTPGKWSSKKTGVKYKFLTDAILNHGKKWNDLLAEFIKKELKGKMFL